MITMSAGSTLSIALCLHENRENNNEVSKQTVFHEMLTMLFYLVPMIVR
jgi:hypothetical protein